MSYLIPIGITAFLLVGFVIFLYVEKKVGKRLFAPLRTRTDSNVSRASFMFSHIDWGGFFGHLAKLSLERVAHDLVHGVLLAVRTVERVLTGMIKTLRERLARRAPGTRTDGFQLGSTLKKFRKSLRKDKDRG